ncbi:MAG: serine hydrolase domain-containing protein [Thermodesulfobacteriota bacterium]|jgi:CubicO group peptidase (beta-lactamase class C family)
MKIIKQMMLVTLCLILIASIASAQGIPKATRPEEVGLSKERLQRISAWIQSDVDKKVVPGAVVMVLRKGKIAYYEAFGYQDREKNIPMTRDSIFRIYSMTKPFTSLAIMMLAEEGKIQLPVPVSLYLPEFKNLKVGVEKKDPATGKTELVLETPSREMTVQDLLRHTSGLTYAFLGKSMVKDRYNEAKTTDYDQTNAELVTKLSLLPLQNHPGTTWDYSQSTDVLARIVEVITGVEFDTFIAERIVKPLKLVDTAFWAEGVGRQARIAEPQINPATGQRPPVIDVRKKPKWLSGASGLVSTAHDYARLCLMFLNGGTLDGVRLVSRKTIEHMTSNNVPPGYKSAYPVQWQIAWPTPSSETGQGFGLGFAINCEPGLSPLPGSKGDYYWTGILGTYFWVDPKEQLIAILMIQAPTQLLPYQYRMRDSVYQAIRD